MRIKMYKQTTPDQMPEWAETATSNYGIAQVASKP